MCAGSLRPILPSEEPSPTAAGKSELSDSRHGDFGSSTNTPAAAEVQARALHRRAHALHIRSAGRPRPAAGRRRTPGSTRHRGPIHSHSRGRYRSRRLGPTTNQVPSPIPSHDPIPSRVPSPNHHHDPSHHHHDPSHRRRAQLGWAGRRTSAIRPGRPHRRVSSWCSSRLRRIGCMPVPQGTRPLVVLGMPRERGARLGIEDASRAGKGPHSRRILSVGERLGTRRERRVKRPACTAPARREKAARIERGFQNEHRDSTRCGGRADREPPSMHARRRFAQAWRSPLADADRCPLPKLASMRERATPGYDGTSLRSP